MKKFEHIIGRLSTASGYLSGVVLILIIFLTLVEVVSRYVLRNPLILCDELGGYSLVLMTFLGLAYCWREKGHIRITFLVDKLPQKAVGWIRVFSLAIIIFYVGLSTKVSWKFLADAFKRNIRSNSLLMTPLKWPQMVIPIGFSLLLLVLVFELIKAIRDIQSDSSLEQGPKGEV